MAKFCSKCGTGLVDTAKFCSKCGTTCPVDSAEPEAAAFVPVIKPKPQVPQQVESPSVFAEGLPEWSIEPPMVVVRRKSRI